MSDYVPIEYPKWVAGVIVADRAEEDAHMEELTAPVVVEPASSVVAEPVAPAAPAATDPAGTGE